MDLRIIRQTTDKKVLYELGGFIYSLIALNYNFPCESHSIFSPLFINGGYRIECVDDNGVYTKNCVWRDR
jgi:hypothetical protein